MGGSPKSAFSFFIATFRAGPEKYLDSVKIYKENHKGNFRNRSCPLFRAAQSRAIFYSNFLVHFLSLPAVLDSGWLRELVRARTAAAVDGGGCKLDDVDVGNEVPVGGG